MMSTKAEQNNADSAADIGKLLLATAVVIAGVAGFFYFEDVATGIRMVALLAAVAVAAGIAAFTARGRVAREFLSESNFELRKVVWPTRQETLQTTLVILVVVIIISIILWIIDMFLAWSVRSMIGG
jgi:preprotein translocase subunit SecE